MKIAMLAPIAWPTPPDGYGPWEQVASHVTEGMVARGHDVTLFATANSRTAGRLVGTAPAGYEQSADVDAGVWKALHYATLFERAGEFDLIHSHCDFEPLIFTRLIDTPMVTTIHGFSSPRIYPVYERYNGETWYVSISDSDRYAKLDYVATVHNGIDLNQFTFRERAGDYLLWIGRIHPDKGTVEAIEIAQRSGVQLVLAGTVHDEAYYHRHVQPRIISEGVEYVGPVGPAERDRLMGGALALVNPIQWDEPFGLVMAEAMACGTPVIVFDRGSARELVADGETGFIVPDVREAALAVKRAGTLDRAACRARVEVHFTVERMVTGYERVYERVVQAWAERRGWAGR